MIACAGLDVHYPGAADDALALRDMAFTLGAGEFVAVTGPNGSGKTTLLRALLRLVLPRRGRVTLDGRDLVRWRRRSLAQTVGALPQREEPAFPMTAHEAVLMGRWARLGPLASVDQADREAVHRALERCDVARFEHRTIDTLSGGEWQRVRLARALVSDPRFLLLDEPTAALDLGHEMELFELLRTLACAGIGIMVITHDLNLAARFADRMLLLDHGVTVVEGSPAQVLREDLISRVFEWPVTITLTADGIPQLVPLRAPQR